MGSSTGPGQCGKGRGGSQYNGVWQDGTIDIHYTAKYRFAEIFLAFASQAAHADGQRGDALPGSRNLTQWITGSSTEGKADGRFELEEYRMFR